MVEIDLEVGYSRLDYAYPQGWSILFAILEHGLSVIHKFVYLFGGFCN